MGFSLKFNVSTAHVKEAYLAKNIANEDASEPLFEKVGAVYHQSDGPFYLQVETAGVVDTIVLKASWIAVNAAGAINQVIGAADYTTDKSQRFYFDYSLPRIWPLGEYKVELYLNEKLDRSIEFTVVGDE